MEHLGVTETIFNHFMNDTNAQQGCCYVYQERDQMHLVNQGALIAIKVVGCSNIIINPKLATTTLTKELLHV